MFENSPLYIISKEFSTDYLKAGWHHMNRFFFLNPFCVIKFIWNKPSIH